MICAACAFVTGVLEELKEVESQGMHESTQDAHGDVQDVANNDDEDEEDPVDATVAQSLHTDGIEGLTEFGTRQTQGIQTQVTQHVTEQARGRVVGLPQTRAHIEQGIAVQVVEEEDAQSGQTADDDNHPLGHRLVHHTHQGETTYDDTAYNEQGPAPST